MVTLFQMIGASFVLIQLLMVSLWLIYYFYRNAGIVDIGWAAGFLIAMVSYFTLGAGDWLKSSILLAMVVGWSVRLGWHLFRRYQHTAEDARYGEVRERLGMRNNDLKFLILFVFQGVLIVVLSLPFLLVTCCPNPSWSIWELLGVIFWAIGVCGEYYADEQLQACKAKASNPQEVCKVGLWRYSRHPNYFFEWIVWIGFFFFAFPAPGGLFAILSPILMFCLLRYFSGIPMTEGHLLRSKGEAYRQYQQTTSEFFPWFPNRQK